ELPVTTIRPFNTYGPRQSARAIIPTIISQILSGFETIKLGNLTPTRDLNFVEDTAQGFITVGLHKNTVGETLNLGTGREISIGDLAAKISNIIGRSVEITTDAQRLRPVNSEVERLLSSPARAMDLTGWSPEHTLTQGLTRTIAWIEKNLSAFKPELYNV
ncbi:GDP-mannose 4,6-dehydratase, partial [Myxococcota bacterium]|nr:GDP-mannose 4,6-dehydratase [Myxococcota bacterium]